MEFALFFVIPRKDTKQIAKDLIKKFGSLKDLINTDFDTLTEAFKKIKGVSVNTAFFFYFLKNF